MVRIAQRKKLFFEMYRMNRVHMAIAVWLLTAAMSRASIITTVTSVPTNPAVGANPNALPGYTTYTITAMSTVVTDKIIGFDFVGNGSNFGFLGAMNQVNPFGLPTIFADNNAVIPAVGATPDQDSQFALLSSTGLVLNASESTSALKAAFNYDAAHIATATNILAIAQIARQFLAPLTYSGTVTVRDGAGRDRLETVSGGVCGDCLPPTIVDAEYNNVNANDPGMVMHTFTMLTYRSTAWSDFTFDSYVPAQGVSGSGPAIHAAFDPLTQKFSWNTVGSPLGTYKWLVTATNLYGSDQGSITVHITVPEPAGLLLASVILATGFVFMRLKKRH